MFNARSGLVECLGEKGRPVLFVGLIRNNGRDPAPARGVAVGLAGVAFIADEGAWRRVRADVEQGVEMARVGGLAAGQVEGYDRARGVRFCMDFRGEAAARTSERLTFLPPFAPAAET